MFYKGKEVEYTDGRSAMEEFVAYLRSTLGPKLLVAHNGRKFDFPRIKRLLDLVGVVIPGNVVGCLDSLLLMRLLYPGEPSYKQGDLVFEISGNWIRSSHGLGGCRSSAEPPEPRRTCPSAGGETNLGRERSRKLVPFLKQIVEVYFQNLKTLNNNLITPITPTIDSFIIGIIRDGEEIAQRHAQVNFDGPYAKIINGLLQPLPKRIRTSAVCEWEAF